MSTREHPPVLAVPPGTQPTIVCPNWCMVSYAEHFGELGDNDGFVIHHSDGGPVRHSRCAYPDNTVDPNEPPTIWIEVSADGVTIEQAKGVLRDLARAIEEASR